MAGNELKTPLAQSLNLLGDRRASDALAKLGKGLPCTVASVVSPGIVMVNFEVEAIPFALPQIKMAVCKHATIQYPIKPGDPGVALSADLRTGALTGLSTSKARLTDTVANLSAMTFFWLGQLDETFVNPNAVTLVSRDGNANVQVSSSGVRVGGANANLFVEGNLGAGNGATGSFTTPTGQTVMVVNGIIVGIY